MTKIKDIPIEWLTYIKKVLSHYLERKNLWIDLRINNYKYLKFHLESFCFLERFTLTDSIIPGVYIFSTKYSMQILANLKVHCNLHGIQSSVFYGENSFFIPCHQNLNDDDLNYFIKVLEVFQK